ncbi:outer membrane immunogenic protein [Methylobacterium phyllostachyos]|uniref:Outer membrane immunogenic protein n=1 Tax=Methylobacterium phyllostachyos TaxID=582672 RepID=A0A1H0JD20_9HYPH|nr:porin family protein [Methylobacterium phyllostachyos]SDO41359.1 outer membrane immunogenic protein [Methylobacterium phyllostachyos]
MKKLLLASTVLVGTAAAASAADLPRRAAPPPAFTPVPVFTWTGFYVGGNAGYGFDANSRRTTNYVLRSGSVVGSEDTAGVINVNKRPNNDGFTGGAQIGYNYQFTPGSGVVIGFEADAQYVDFARRANATLNYTGLGFAGTAFSGQHPYVATSGNGLDYFGTARGRLGYAFDRTLVYATGGYAYGSGQDDQNFAGRRFRDSFRTGYAVGGGVEYALPTDSFLNFFKSSAVTFKVEGLYVNLDRQKNAAAGVYVPGLPAPAGTVYLNGGAAKTEFAVVRAGVNYKFGSY